MAEPRTLPTPRKDEPRSAVELIRMVRGDLALMVYKKDFSEGKLEAAEGLLTTALGLLEGEVDDGK